MDTAADIGISEDEFWGLLPREFARRLRAHRERAEWELERMADFAAYLRNDIVQALSSKRVRRHTGAMLLGKAKATGDAPMTKAEYLEAVARIRQRQQNGDKEVVH